MLQDQLFLYIRENVWVIAGAGIALFFLSAILIQVSRTRREVHKICQKIRKYFDVILSEPQEEEEPQESGQKEEEVPVYQMSERFSEKQKEREKEEKRKQEQKNQKDAKLLMDIIQDVF